MIKGFLFDYDGVMTALKNEHKMSDVLAAVLGVSLDQGSELFTAAWPDFLRGKVDEAGFWNIVEVKSGKQVPTEQRKIWKTWDDLQPLPEMRELVKSLRADGYQVGLLTNITSSAEEDVRTHGGYDGFDFLVKSCEVGFAKPDPEIYALAMEHFTDVAPDEVIFIDDRERCLEPAREMGMQTILSTGSSQVIAAVREVLAHE